MQPRTVTVQTTVRPPLLAWRYAVVSRLGQGAACSVWLVYDVSLRAWRAAKIMHPETAADDDVRERFLREAVSMANLDHPNVVRVLDVAYDTDVPWLVMELCEGGSTAQWLRRHKHMSALQALGATVDLCAALEAVHEEEIVHRDVKPHNVLVDRSGACKLTDFGVARLPRVRDRLDELEQHATSTGTVMGTMAFMAPEQRADSSTVDGRADVYGAGATLYSFLTGRAAPDLALVGRNDPRVLALPPLLVPVMLRACAFRPEDRYGSAAEMADALVRVRRLIPDQGGAPLGGTMGLPSTPPRFLDANAAEAIGSLGGMGGITGSYEGDTSTGPSLRPRSFPPSYTPAAVPVTTYAPAPTARDPRRYAAPAMAGVAGLGIVVILGAILAASGARSVGEAHRGALVAEQRFQVILERHAAIVGDLVSAGAARDPLETAFGAFDTAGSSQRSARAEALYRLIDQQYELVAGGSRGMAQSAMGDLRSAHHDLESAQDAWRERAASIGGAAAVSLGLATPPPP